MVLSTSKGDACLYLAFPQRRACKGPLVPETSPLIPVTTPLIPETTLVTEDHASKHSAEAELANASNQLCRVRRGKCRSTIRSP
jgi:hypothetical protein